MRRVVPPASQARGPVRVRGRPAWPARELPSLNTDWTPLTRLARESGVPVRTMRRRMAALHQQLGGGVLRAYNEPGTRVGKWWVNVTVLQAHHGRAEAEAERERVEDQQEAVQAQLGEHLLRIEAVERKTQALRDRAIAQRKRLERVEQLVLRFEQPPESRPAGAGPGRDNPAG